jgi:UDP-N-acetylglucosamine--dolichyl-phosphate N-acetylglucosaminephosphotransferase
MTPIFVLLAVGVTGVASYDLASFFSRKFVALGITGVDIHKLERPIIPEMGGLSVLLAVSLGSTILMALDGDRGFLFLAGVSTVSLTGLIGVADDKFELRQRDKTILIAAASALLSLSLVGRGSIWFPVIGTVPFGILYPLLVVPIAITTSANMSNMLAGFNGLEAGIAAISVGVMTFLSAVTGSADGALLGVILLVAYLGFLLLNWYPAKIFPGDTGTLMFGAGIAAIGLISHLEIAAIVLVMPAALDFALKLMSKRPFGQRKVYGNTKVNPDGTLAPANYPALVHAFMSVAPTKERTLVVWVLVMEGLYAILAVAVTLVKF